MTSFRDCCDSGCCPQAGNDNFGGFGSMRGGRSFSFHRDQCQDVPPSGFKSLGNFPISSGSLRGSVHVNLNGDMVGKFSGKIDGLSRLLGCVGNLGNLGSLGLNFPFSVQFGNRTI